MKNCGTWDCTEVLKSIFIYNSFNPLRVDFLTLYFKEVCQSEPSLFEKNLKDYSSGSGGHRLIFPQSKHPYLEACFAKLVQNTSTQFLVTAGFDFSQDQASWNDFAVPSSLFFLQWRVQKWRASLQKFKPENCLRSPHHSHVDIPKILTGKTNGVFII